MPRLGGLGPSVGAAASLLAAGVAISLLVASLFGVRVWPSPSDHGDAGSVQLAPTAVPAVAVADREPEPARPRVAAARPVATATATATAGKTRVGARRAARRPATP